MRITFNTDPMLVATFHVPDYDEWASVPVIGWDEFGRAMVATPSGKAEPAMNLPGFREIDTHVLGALDGRYMQWMPESEWSKNRRMKRLEKESKDETASEAGADE